MPASREPIDAFLSQKTKQYVNSAEAGRAADFEAPIEAALLFADISGFSKLARRLAERGSEGAEQLTSILNTYFEQLLQVVEAHQCDVIAFAGDAVIGLLAGESLFECTTRAAHCGLEITQTLSNYDISDDVQLSIRVSVGAGQISVQAVGDAHNRQLLLVGPALQQIRTADHAAQPGDTVLSAEAAQLLADIVDGDSIIGGPMRLRNISYQVPTSPLQESQPVPAALKSALRSFVPDPVLSHIDLGQTDWLAELRRVTVAFVRLDSVRSDSLDCGAALKQASQDLYRIIRKYDGTVIQLIADDKGTVAVTCFGIPPHSPEHQALRAVRAGEAMIEVSQGQGKPCSVGISTGNVFCGPLGSRLRRCYTVIGDVVNLAARMMQSSQGEVLCDQATFAECRQEVAFSRLPNHRIKGYADPVPVYRAAAHTADWALIGREKELGMLADIVAATAGGEYQKLIIVGEPGVGKSELAGAIVHQAEAKGQIAIRAEASHIDRGTPFHALGNVLFQLLQLSRVDQRPGAREAAAVEALAFLEAPLQRILPLLNDILGLQLAETEFVKQLNGSRRLDNLSMLLTTIFRELSHNLQLHYLILDDVQSLDDASWQFLRSTDEQDIRLTTVLLARPEAHEHLEIYSKSYAAGQVRWIELQPLDRGQTRELISQRVGRFDLDDLLVAHIWTRSGGNPFFAIELVKFLAETNRLIVDANVCRAACTNPQEEELAIPNSILDVLTGRFNQLSQPTQLTAKSASVIGRRFGYDVLEAVFPVETLQPQLPEFVLDLCAQDMLAPFEDRASKNASCQLPAADNSQLATDELPEALAEPTRTHKLPVKYIWRHITTQQVAYQQLPVAQRRQFHGKIADWYQRLPQLEERHHAIIASHLEKAGRLSEAGRAFARAGEYALRQGATAKALEQLRKALQYAVPHAQDGTSDATPADQTGRKNDNTGRLWEGHFRRLLGEALMQAGDIEASRRELEAALELLGQPVPQGFHRNLFVLVLLLVRQRIRRLRGRNTTKNFLTDEPQIGDVAHCAALANQRLAQIHYFSNDLVIGTSRALRALTVAESVDDSPGLARSYADLCMVMSLLKRCRGADYYAALAEQVARSVAHLPSLAYVLNVTNMHRLAHGRWQQVQQLATESVQIGLALHCDRDRAESLCVLAMQQCFTAQLSAGLRNFDELLRIATRAKNSLHCAWAECGRGEALLRMGNYHQALPALTRACQFLENSTSHTEELRARGLRGLCLWRMQRYDEALTQVQDVDRLLALKATVTCSALEGLTSTAEVLFDSLRRAPADSQQAAMAKRLLQHFSKFCRVFPIGRPAYLRFQGAWLALAGKQPAAQRCWQAAQSISQRLDMPFEEGLALLEQSKYAHEPERKRFAQNAYAILQATECLPHAQAAQAAADS